MSLAKLQLKTGVPISIRGGGASLSLKSRMAGVPETVGVRKVCLRTSAKGGVGLTDDAMT